MAKNLPAMQETLVQSLGGKIPRRREWKHTPVFLPGEFHAQRSWLGYSPWGHKVSDTTEQLTLIPLEGRAISSTEKPFSYTSKISINALC